MRIADLDVLDGAVGNDREHHVNPAGQVAPLRSTRILRRNVAHSRQRTDRNETDSVGIGLPGSICQSVRLFRGDRAVSRRRVGPGSGRFAGSIDNRCDRRIILGNGFFDRARVRDRQRVVSCHLGSGLCLRLGLGGQPCCSGALCRSLFGSFPFRLRTACGLEFGGKPLGFGALSCRLFCSPALADNPLACGSERGIGAREFCALG